MSSKIFFRGSVFANTRVEVTEKMEKSENLFDLCKIKSSKIVANAIGSIEQAMLRVVRSEQCLAINL